MKYEYKTIFAETSAAFDAKLNKYGAQGYILDKFEYREYVHRVKEEGPTIVQAYVGVMLRAVDADAVPDDAD